MPAISIDKIFFLPAIAIARLGASPVPLEAFTWDEDPNSFGAGQTVIVPQVSLQVLPDGSIDPYLPRDLQFQDAGMIRPVCPFLEVGALYTRQGESQEEGRLTPQLLEEAGLSLGHLSFNVIAANRKAARHTGDEACAFEARLLVQAVDYEKKELLAFTRSTQGVPLVSERHPIPLGSFQVIRPCAVSEKRLGVALDVIRVRFTPARGEVYGPPDAIRGQTTDSRSRHVIVADRNRILNADSSWTRFTLVAGAPSPSAPADTYDGESDLDHDRKSWGVVDDTCDAVVTATLADCKGGAATAHIFVGPPHFSPDRRPFYSWADELADRDPSSVPSCEQGNDLLASVVDLFRRVLETAAVVNVDRQRNRAITTNADFHIEPVCTFPAIDDKTMTLQDKIEGRLFISDFLETDLKCRAGEASGGAALLALAEIAREQHQQLADPEYLMNFLLEQQERLKDILRPPFAYLDELPEHSEEHGLRDFRDPRINRDRAHDMRMPPYMRDSDFSALSITRRQWDQIQKLIACLQDGEKGKGSLPDLSDAAKNIKAYHERKKK